MACCGGVGIMHDGDDRWWADEESASSFFCDGRRRDRGRLWLHVGMKRRQSSPFMTPPALFTPLLAAKGILSPAPSIPNPIF